MKRLLAVVLLLLVCAAFGQEKQSECPIVFTKIMPNSIEHNHYNFWVKYRNTASKVIVGLKFNAAFYDSTNDRHETSVTWSAGDKLAPGKKADNSWDDDYYVNSYSHRNADIWPTKVLFDDGSVWQDDGTHSCMANSQTKLGNFKD